MAVRRKPDQALIAAMQQDVDRPVEEVIAEAERRVEQEFCAARQFSANGGRLSAHDQRRMLQRRASGMSIREVAEEFGCLPRTAQRYLMEYR